MERERVQDSLDRYYDAMRRGRAAEDQLVELFTDDGVYSTDLLGKRTEVVGRPAIRHWLSRSWEQSPPEMELSVDEVVVEEGSATVRWTCTSPVFHGPMRGTDRFELEGERIRRLHTTLDAEG